MIEDINNFNIKTTDSERIERINICGNCEENKIIGDDNLCMKCACPIDYVTSHKYKNCPLGKWIVE